MYIINTRTPAHIYICSILTSDPAVDQGTGASGRRYQGRTVTVDGLNWVQMCRPQEAGGCQTIIKHVSSDRFGKFGVS